MKKTPRIKIELQYSGKVRTGAHSNGGDLDIDSITVIVLEGQVEIQQGSGNIDTVGPKGTWTINPKLRVVQA